MSLANLGKGYQNGGPRGFADGYAGHHIPRHEKDFDLPWSNESRALRKIVRRYAVFDYQSVGLEAEKDSRPSRVPVVQPSPKVLEQFQGFVVKVDEEGAHVTLKTDQGEEFTGTYPAAELAAKGVGEGDRFHLATVEQGDAVLFDIKPIPRRAISPSEQRAIREEIARELGDYSAVDDY